MPKYTVEFEKSYHHEDNGNDTIQVSGTAEVEADSPEQAEAKAGAEIKQTIDPRITWEGRGEDPVNLADRGYTYTDWTFGVVKGSAKRLYKSQSARDAQAGGYGDEKYCDYLDQHAQELHDKLMAEGKEAEAKSMFTRSLSESLMGNEGA